MYQTTKLKTLLHSIDAHRLAVEDLITHDAFLVLLKTASPEINAALNTALSNALRTQREMVLAREAMTEDWEDVAVYFADCEAATAYTYGTTKSLSRHETERHANICESLAASLQEGVLINKRPSNREKTIQRLLDSASLCRKKLVK